MNNTGTLKVTAPTDREIVMTRVFDAPRTLVWDALTRPELLRQWFFGPPGWSLVVCDIDLTVGGAYRYSSREARDAVLKTPMEHGVAVGYDRLAELLASTA